MHFQYIQLFASFLKFYRSTGERIILAELQEDIGEFQSWLDKAECVTALPVEPDHREQLNTALEKVQVELVFNSKTLFSKKALQICLKMNVYKCVFYLFLTPLDSSSRITKQNKNIQQNKNKSFVSVC